MASFEVVMPAAPHTVAEAEAEAPVSEMVAVLCTVVHDPDGVVVAVGEGSFGSR